MGDSRARGGLPPGARTGPRSGSGLALVRSQKEKSQPRGRCSMAPSRNGRGIAGAGPAPARERADRPRRPGSSTSARSRCRVGGDRRTVRLHGVQASAAQARGAVQLAEGSGDGAVPSLRRACRTLAGSPASLRDRHARALLAAASAPPTLEDAELERRAAASTFKGLGQISPRRARSPVKRCRRMDAAA